MHQELYNALVQLARKRKIASYTEVAPVADLDMNVEEDRRQMSEYLAEIARFEYFQQRPMLTSVVIHQGNNNNPGEGFFSVAQELGLFQGSRNELARTQFWVCQVAEVFDYWRAS